VREVSDSNLLREMGATVNRHRFAKNSLGTRATEGIATCRRLHFEFRIVDIHNFSVIRSKSQNIVKLIRPSNSAPIFWRLLSPKFQP